MKKFSFRKKFLETLCKCIYLEFQTKNLEHFFWRTAPLAVSGLNVPKLVRNLFKVKNKKISFVVFIAEFEQTLKVVQASDVNFVHIITS